MEYWTNLYIQDTIFKELEWHDSYVFWQCVKRIAPNDGVDIGKGAGAKGHHVFVNSVLGQYIDHFKGKRKLHKTSARNDFRANPNAAVKFDEIDYWKKVPPS